MLISGKQLIGCNWLGEVYQQTQQFTAFKKMASKNLRLRDDDDITVEDFTAYYDANVTAYPGQINTNLVDWREKTQEETIEYVVPNDLDSN